MNKTVIADRDIRKLLHCNAIAIHKSLDNVEQQSIIIKQ